VVRRGAGVCGVGGGSKNVLARRNIFYGWPLKMRVEPPGTGGIDVDVVGTLCRGEGVPTREKSPENGCLCDKQH
jgi:hypothetical protein